MAVIEYARNILSWRDIHSSEFDSGCAHPVIDLMPDQHGNLPKGRYYAAGRVSLPQSLAPYWKRLIKARITERHRHRYELNNSYRRQLEEAGMVLAGTSPDGRLVEAVELPEYDFYVGVQYHPEFKSRPNRAHPLFGSLSPRR